MTDVTPIPIKIKYHDPEMPRLEKIIIGDWIDLRAAEDVVLGIGERTKVSLGVSMELPPGYEAYLLPRSSSCDKFGFIVTNSEGVIDESYSGNNDVWKLAIMAVEDRAVIKKYARIAQFRIMKKMPPVEIIEVEDLDSPDRGGFGVTGTN